MHRSVPLPDLQRIRLPQRLGQVVLRVVRAVGTSGRCGSSAASAADSVQPVPCVFFVSTRGREISIMRSR